MRRRPPPQMRRERLADLPLERRRDRVAAYLYGNVLVLAAVLTATPHTIEDGHAAIAVLATTITTYLAHMLAHSVASTVGSPDSSPTISRHEFRDALPIVTSGSVPTIVLALGAVTEMSTGLAEVIAAAVVIVRLVGIGSLVAWYGEQPRARTRALGVGVALVSAVIVAAKLVLLH